MDAPYQISTPTKPLLIKIIPKFPKIIKKCESTFPSALQAQA